MQSQLTASIAFSESIQDVGHSDSHLQIGVLRKRENVLPDGISDACLFEPFGDVSFDLYANFPNVGDRFLGSPNDQAQSFLQKGLSVGRDANFPQRVDGCNFEVEAGIFGQHVAQLAHKPRNPSCSVYFGILCYSLNGHLSDSPDSVFQKVQNQRL